MAKLTDRDMLTDRDKVATVTGGWLVLQSEYDGMEDGGLKMAATFFSAKEDAVAFAEHVIRDEWEVVVDADEGGNTRLADLRGYVYPKGTIKWSQAFFSGNGDEAWAKVDGGNVLKLKIVPVLKEGERTC